MASEAQEELTTLAVLIDADNLSPALAGDIFETACKLGKPIVRRAYGMVNCFSCAEGWSKPQREYGIVACPQVSNIAHKNVADIALVIDAMELLYKGHCQGFCIVSSDSDFTALVAKIREAGKLAYGIGDAKSPASFRAACTRFFELPKLAQVKSEKKAAPVAVCPRCGSKLVPSRTKSNQNCRMCETCGGVTIKLNLLKKIFDEDGLQGILTQAREHRQTGCLCPDCGLPMTLLHVASGKKSIEIDVCAKCQAIWYDKNEFETLVPSDGILQPNVSAGKAYRREMAMTLEADLRNGKLKVNNLSQLKTQMQTVYHVPVPDISPLIGTLQCRKVISLAPQTGKINIPLQQ